MYNYEPTKLAADLFGGTEYGMAYQALYRKWRPMTFDDVVGQEHITQTLKNEIINNQLAHAYLFCGTRGTGKTSTAKILSRAVNCENPKDGNPCNECDTCRGIIDESIMDVLELDGASRNKVENIRDIIEDVVFLPSQARKKVYIIDEVHMVTQAAFNALLKTLEEPPEHVMFILATTELNKIPPTVLSRCQRFDFRRITNDDIVDRLNEVTNSIGRHATSEALSLVAELGNGSMRDSLSILDQCLGYSDGELGYDDILEIVGIVDYDTFYSLCDAVRTHNGGKALSILDEAIAYGKEPEVLIDSFIKFIRDLLVVKLTDEPCKIINTSSENLVKMQNLAGLLTSEKLINSLKLLNESVVQAKALAFKRTVYELALIKMCDPRADVSYESLLDRLSELENTIKNDDFKIPRSNIETKKHNLDTSALQEGTPEKKQPGVSEKQDIEKTTKKDNVPGNQNAESNNSDVLDKWDEIKLYIKAHGGLPLLPHLNNAKPVIIKDKLALVFEQNALMSKTVTSKQGYLDLIKISVKALTGREVTVACHTTKEVDVSGDTFKNENLQKLVNLAKTYDNIEIIE